jgi:hypothetical protein
MHSELYYDKLSSKRLSVLGATVTRQSAMGYRSDDGKSKYRSSAAQTMQEAACRPCRDLSR